MRPASPRTLHLLEGPDGPIRALEARPHGPLGRRLRGIREVDGVEMTIDLLDVVKDQRAGLRATLGDDLAQGRLLVGLPIHPYACLAEGVSGELALARPRLEGGTLAERVARGPLPTLGLLGLGRALARLLLRAHKRRRCFGWLPPASIHLGAEVGIIDEGIGRHLFGGLHAPPPLDPAWASPAVHAGGAPTPHDDLLALLALLRGCPRPAGPFEAELEAALAAPYERLEGLAWALDGLIALHQLPTHARDVIRARRGEGRPVEGQSAWSLGMLGSAGAQFKTDG